MNDQILQTNASIISCASVVGHKEHDGPIGSCFDEYDASDKFGKKTWELAESEMQRRAMSKALSKSGLGISDVGAMFAGDLLNQCTGSAYGVLDFDIPYFGLYGACSTAAEGLMLASLLISGGHLEHCAAITSSHFCSAEQQYRTPLEYGGQRSPTAQWTVTGSAAFILGKPHSRSNRICACLPGIVIDQGINDAANMGAAMMPAALDTLVRFFRESGTSPKDYDAIYSGDLGFEGSKLLREFMRAEGYLLEENYFDCGNIIFDREAQDVHSGGSGCGCSAVVLASHILPKVNCGELSKVLFMGTGAMMSPLSLKQGQSIPAVAHLIMIEHKE